MAGTGDIHAPAYFDAASAAPLHPAARAMIAEIVDEAWVDPTKLYTAARRARLLLERSREAVAAIVGARTEEVSFVASGTEACHLAVAGLLEGRRRAGRTLVHSAIEHSAVLHAAERGESIAVGVDRLGAVDIAAFATAVAQPGVAAAALLSASHEVGTVQDTAAAGAACADAGVPLLVDAAQSLGRVPVPPEWSVLTASARKWGGPAGVGLLVVRAGVRYDPPPLAAAVPSPLLVAAAAAALVGASGEAAAQDARLRPLVERIRATVAATVPDVEVVGDPERRLPHLVTFSCLYVDGEALLHALDGRGFAVSSGSSCTSDTLRPSHVLEAMGVLSHGNVRVSLHRDTTAEEVDRLLAELPGIVRRLRAEAGVLDL